MGWDFVTFGRAFFLISFSCIVVSEDGRKMLSLSPLWPGRDFYFLKIEDKRGERECEREKERERERKKGGKFCFSSCLIFHRVELSPKHLQIYSDVRAKVLCVDFYALSFRRRQTAIVRHAGKAKTRTEEEEK